MRTIHIMSGLPGSGKSTWIDKRVCPDSPDLVLRRDDRRELLRQELGLSHPQDCPAKLEYIRWGEYLRDSIYHAPDDCHIYIDQTTLTIGALRKLMSAILMVISSQDNIIIERIHTNFKECLRRNAERTGDARVPDEVMYSMRTSINKDPITWEAVHQIYPWMNVTINHDTSMEVS